MFTQRQAPTFGFMELFGRTPELGRLRAALDRRRSSVLRVSGIRGAGKSALVAHVLSDYGELLHVAPPLPDDEQRRTLHERLRRARDERGLEKRDVGEAPPPWRALLQGVLDLAPADGRPLGLALDDVHRLAEARSPYLDAVLGMLEAARSEGRPLHVVLIGPDHAMPADEDLSDFAGEVVRVGPLPFRPASRLLPGSRPTDLVRAYGIFGGLPRVLACLDRSVTVGTNLRRLVLQPGSVLSDFGGNWLERDVQAPARYYAVLRTLSEGEADWSALHRGVPDLTRSGQLAPYVHRLEELGLVTVRRSLDAAPTARSTRYAVADPFIAFWCRFVLGTAVDALSEATPDVYSSLVRPRLDEHVARFFPLVCRQHVAHDGIETLGANAREAGSLWGSDYDIPIAGILTSGAAYYGSCHWGSMPESDAPLQELDRQIRETRFGFGRETRLRIVFTGSAPPRWLLREAARRDDVEVIDAEALVGAD